MRKKLFTILVCMLFISTIITITETVLAGDEENPEIIDEEEDDIISYLDLYSAWFDEKEDEPDFLYAYIKINEINPYHLKQHITIHWDYNGEKCAAGLHIGYGSPWYSYSAGYGQGWWFKEHYEEITGDFDENGIITLKIPKEYILNPEEGDVLENTYALSFQRFGFIGRMGFGRPFITSFLTILFGKSLSDRAPNDGFGIDYVIQY